MSTVMRWLTKMPDALSVVLLLSALGGVYSLHDRLSDLERQMSDIKELLEVRQQ